MAKRPDRDERRGRRGEGGADREIDSRVLEISRVTRVTKGGKRMRFRATVVVGDHKGRVGFGVAKGVDVQAAVGKATRQAQKRMIRVPMVMETIPHVAKAKFSAASVLIKPAPKGTGVKAGGAVRVVFELAGIPNVVSKIMGSKNKINNVKAPFAGLAMLRPPRTKRVEEERVAAGGEEQSKV